LFELPGSHYRPPEFSLKFEAAPARIGFLNGVVSLSNGAGLRNLSPAALKIKPQYELN